jgi:hypothetical protein
MAVTVADVAGPVALLFGLAVAGTAPSCAKGARTDGPSEPGVAETHASEMPTSSAGRGIACGPRGLPPDRHYVADGLCARVMAHGQGALRGLAFAPNGDLFAVTNDGQVRRYRDVDKDGIFAAGPPETTEWAKAADGDATHDCRFDGQDLYCTSKGRVVRWHTTPDADEGGAAEEVVVGIPARGRRPRNSLGIWDGQLYVSNSADDGAVKRFPLSQYVPARPFAWKEGELFDTGLRSVKAIAHDRSGRIVAIDGAPGDPDAPEPVHVLEKEGSANDRSRARGPTPPVSLLPARSAATSIALPANGARFALPSKWSAEGAFIAMRGGPDGARATGHKVVWLPLAEEREIEVVFGGGRDGAHRDGEWSWRVGEASDDPVRPVSLAISPADGGLYVSSDGGAIYRIAILGR